MEEKRERWGGRLAFIMAAIGSAVGLGNVWRFPYIAYKNGGGAFFIPYFVALITAGIPLLILEYSLGQKFQAGAPGALRRIGKGWRWLGWFAVFVGLSISFYYVQIMALSWHYMIASTNQAWTQPVDNRTIFKAKFRLYRTDFERAQIEGELKRKQISHVKLVHISDRDKAKEDLKQEIKKQWGEDTVTFTELAAVTAYADDYLKNRAKYEEESPKVRFAILSDDELASLDSALALYYSGKERERYHNAQPDDDLGILPEEKLTIIETDANVGLYFEEEALGGFGTWLASAARATSRSQLITEALGIVEDPTADLGPLFKEPLQGVTLFSKHVASSYTEVKNTHDGLRATHDAEDTEALWQRLKAARGDLASALRAKLIEPQGTFSLSTHLVFWAAVTWILIFLIIFKGVHVVGKVVMFTVPVPVVILGVLIVHGLTLDGAGQGIEFFLNPDWGLIRDPSVWVAAYGQIFFSLSLGFGIMIAYASYMPRESDVSNNAFMTCFGNCCTSFYAAFAVFSVLGYLAVALNKGVADVVKGGPGLVFVTYPVALTEMGSVGSIVGFLFFLSLLMLGIDSAFSIVEAFITGLRDYVAGISKPMLTAIVCAVGFCATCWYCTRSGLMWLDIVDNWMSNYGLPIVGLLECIAVGYFFNLEEVRTFVNERSEIRLMGWWDACIKVVTPLILFVILFQQVLNDVTSPYGGYDKVIPYSVNLAGWGYFGGMILVAFLITRSWLHVIWSATAVAFALLLRLGGLPATHSVLGGIGFTLLFGGLGTCLYIAATTKKPEPPAPQAEG
ncbi:hypothetical protein ACFL59_02090 [Planctomycetota bacterium]